jgi:hypothetical protein
VRYLAGLPKGARVAREKSFRTKPDGSKYHAADVNGRMYWCGCMGCVRHDGVWKVHGQAVKQQAKGRDAWRLRKRVQRKESQ